jgi:outer membrane protein OmpA-like peptidoglycan-associated protein
MSDGAGTTPKWWDWISENLLRTPMTVVAVMVASVFAGGWLFGTESAQPVLVVTGQEPSGAPIEISYRFFETNGYMLSPGGEGEVRKQTASINKDAKILILGFADRRRGVKVSNKDLGRLRANSVEAFLRKEGFMHLRVVPVGDSAAADCKTGTKAEQAKCLGDDRRVEIHVISR